MCADRSTDDLATLDGIFADFDRSDAPGLLVGVARHGRPIYRRGFGLASVRHGVANQAATRIRIASTSKQFTCLAILLLAEDGLLDIDVPADRYVDGLPALPVTPTLRHFMTHTSGYRCSLEMGTMANGTVPQPMGWQQQAIARQCQSHFAPGTAQMYCNGTYVLLADVIEKVSGMPFEAFLTSRIFEPLGMHDTESVASDSIMVPGCASLHVQGGDGRWQSPPSDAPLRGDGGVISTVDDMLRWMAHLNGAKRVGNEDTWRKMLSPTVLANGFKSTYLMGLKRTIYRGVETIHHSGGLFGLNAQMLTVPAQGLDIMIMVNGAPANSSRLARQVVDALLPQQLEPAGAAVPVAPWQHLVGSRYADEQGLVIGFAESDGTLSLSMANMPPAPVLRDDGDALTLPFEDVGLGPYAWTKASLKASADGQAPERIAALVSGASRSMRRLTSSSDLGLDHALLVGSYVSPDLTADARISFDASDPVLHIRGDYSGWRSFRMERWSDTLFGITNVLAPDERYVVDVDVGASPPSGFWLDAFRARRLRFDSVPEAISSPAP